MALSVAFSQNKALGESLGISAKQLVGVRTQRISYPFQRHRQHPRTDRKPRPNQRILHP